MLVSHNDICKGPNFGLTHSGFCIAKCHTHCSLEEEVREVLILFLAPAAEYTEVSLIKAVTQNTCLISSIGLQMKKLPNAALYNSH